ncbi:putative Flagellar hook-associated protein 1 [Candidatus Zixiibacteriota bacterium]|nr:putative Flagellar hook-associated protein 1 [candidate division Zixibacteria bacterium]
MAGLFDALEMGKRALATQQLWLNTIGHNISNVESPGYTRQRVLTNTSPAISTPAGLVGTGVNATNILQIRDLFLNQQYREENKSLGQWTTLDKTLNQIQALFSEPNTDSLSDLLDKFWSSWSDLANNPESVSARSALKEQTNLLTNSFHRIYAQLSDMRNSVDSDVQLTVDKVNSIASEIGNLNEQIARLELGGQKANDLRDRRDYLIDQLSQYVDVNSVEQKNNMMTVYIGALAIVDGTSSFKLGTKKVGVENATSYDIVWAGTSKTIKNLNGELKGLVETRDNLIPKYQNYLDSLAESLVSQVNAVHQTGYGLDGSTGLGFFNPLNSNAATISLNDLIANDVNRIAASQSGEVGDNVIALAIADLRSAAAMMRGTASFSEFYNSMIGEIGTETNKAGNLKDNYGLLVQQLDNSRQSVQGVSLDEEMAQMVKYQHAFDAASRVITTMDQALETVIKGMGIVGR